MTRKMTIVAERRSKDEPCIRIADTQLAKVGFSFGDLVAITYKKNIIVIKRINKMNHE